jgi:hypothetical protein
LLLEDHCDPVPGHEHRRAGGDDREEREDGGKGEDGARFEQPAVGMGGPEGLLGQHLHRVRDDVREPAQRAVAQPGEVDPRAVGADPVLNQRAPFPLGDGEHGGDQHHEEQHQEDDVAESPVATLFATQQGRHPVSRR